MKTHARSYRSWFIALLLATLAGCGGNGPESDAFGASNAEPRYSISGSISVAADTAVDSDVNNPAAPNLPNDHAEQAQSLAGVSLIGGFATAEPTARDGDYFAAMADPRDVYRLPLVAGQTVWLEVAARSAGADEVDFGLYLYAVGEHEAPLAASRSLAAVESLRVPSGLDTGEYDVVVKAHAGASNYILELGPAEQALPNSLAVSDEAFVPGDLIVVFNDESEPAVSRQARAPGERAAELGLLHRRGARGQAQLLGLGHGLQRQAALQQLGVDLPPSMTRALNRLDEQARAREETKLAVQALRQRDDVRYADLNYLRRPAFAPNDPFFERQWHYRQIDLPGAWSVTTGDSAVVVAVVDTGVYLAHPDLSPNLLDSGYNFVREEGIGPNPDDPGGAGRRGSFHGTHVAGTVAAASDNGEGVAGVAWRAGLLPIRVCGEQGCSSYDLMQGVRYAAGLSNDSGTVPPQPADIINISLGGSGFSGAEQALYDKVRSQGIFVVASAGNGNTSAPTYPAAYSSVLSVGAVDARKQRAPYSNYGTYVDLVAPGGNMRRDDTGSGEPDGVLSTVAVQHNGERTAGYGFAQGTSMAAPHVAGVIALMKAVYPDLTPGEFEHWLQAGRVTEDLGMPGWDNEFGWGLINARQAVLHAQSAAGGQPLPASLSVAPRILDFGVANSLQYLALTLNDEEDRITEVVAEADWLHVEPAAVDQHGSGRYRVTVLRENLAPGSYYGAIRIVTSAEEQVDIPVLMQRVASRGEAGIFYVVLVDADSGRVVDSVQAEYRDGAYRYSFEGVPAGRYQVYAGTDNDNDRYICGLGEACGAYPSLSKPETVPVDGNRDGLDFAATYRRPSQHSLNAADVEPIGIGRRKTD
ncbi:hypothetical protein CAI21_08130 [Alkalilimnicola ehrlichii]|uniref:Peptidase S8/S53 domain-containing protein n=1 Tax=Alkalilimnicola ehrlichii TaxID=351052 RepID=A0A3E0WZR3_9GAMM|nr:S8 family serine peptidase [Alkalilimnicola ehrlichii]RFA30147.1 hypothetical protein CAI21_08130 [Alkalilimnicola ehrlichii]RFA37495.1 hypothetical protein CAL65_09475 [Alkalilimnicola ehrlichii]